MRILIVEDEPLVAQGLKQGLEQLRYTVDVASSAELDSHNTGFRHQEST